MKSLLIFTLLLASASVFAQENSRAGVITTAEMTQRRPSKKYFKNVVQVEALGRGLLYGLSYERMLNPEVSLGIGYSYTTINSAFGFGKTDFRLMSVPLYVNYYLNPGRHNIVLTGGVNLFSFEAKARLSDEFQSSLTAAANEAGAENYDFAGLEFSGSALIPIPQAGIGYEFRANSGFMTKLNLYGMYALGKFVPWAGLGIGVAF